MTKEELLTHAKEYYGTNPDYPWEGDDSAVLRHPENRKWYGLIMTIPGRRLCLECERVTVLNIKCDPLLIGSLLKKDGYFPAYHMNKDKWITVRLDSDIDNDEIFELLDMSFRLTEGKK